MVKVRRIEFQVDATKGELPYRSYTSTEPVKGHLFVLASKITNDEQVYFELYSCDTKTGDVTKRVATTTTMEAFHKSVHILEADLQKDNPSVKMIRQDGDNIAMTNDGPLSPEDAAAFARVADLNALGNFVVEKAKEDGAPPEVIQSLQEIVELTAALQGQMADGNIDKAELLIKALRAQHFPPEMLVDLFAQMTVEEQNRVVQFLNQQENAQQGASFFSAMDKLNKPNLHSSNRLKKYF